MFSNTIKFIANKDYINITKIKPEPTILNVPKWYKDLTHTIDKKTVKGCMPFLDTLTAGYILKTPIDYYIKHNTIKDGERGTIGLSKVGINEFNNLISNLNINKQSADIHSVAQLGKGCPHVQKNKDLAFHKILNPWVIKTPPGYSCLFISPMNNHDDRFSIIPGIVDTDSHPTEINFPIIINGDKYPLLDTTIKMGTPYVQIIPFKRERWKMKIEPNNKKETDAVAFSMGTVVLNTYKNKWWSKKSWK